MKKKLFMSVASLVSVVALIGVYLLSPALAATTIEVSPFNTNGWFFQQETPTGTGGFVNGPGTPPMGNGSAQLTVDTMDACSYLMEDMQEQN